MVSPFLRLIGSLGEKINNPAGRRAISCPVWLGVRFYLTRSTPHHRKLSNPLTRFVDSTVFSNLKQELFELYHRGAEGSGQESAACHRHFLHPRHRGVRVHQRVLLHDAVAGGGARLGGRGRDLRGSGVWHVRVDHSG